MLERREEELRRRREREMDGESEDGDRDAEARKNPAEAGRHERREIRKLLKAEERNQSHETITYNEIELQRHTSKPRKTFEWRLVTQDQLRRLGAHTFRLNSATIDPNNDAS